MLAIYRQALDAKYSQTQVQTESLRMRAVVDIAFLGQYALTFRPHPAAPSALANPEKHTVYRRLTLEERAVSSLFVQTMAVLNVLQRRLSWP